MNLNQKVLAKLYDIISESKQKMFDSIAADRTNHLAVVLENIHHDHNASAVLRSCDCFGIQNMYTIEKNHSYKIQRDIARGAGRWVDMHTFSGENPTLDCIQELKRNNYKIYAASPHENQVTLDQLPLKQPMAIVFGTEWHGISEDIKPHLDGSFVIPMHGFTESFNVSVSAALVLYDLRTRLKESQIDFKLNKQQQELLKIKWCSKILKNGSELVREIEKRILEQSV